MKLWVAVPPRWGLGVGVLGVWRVWLDLLGLAGMLLEVQGAVAVDTGLAHLSAALDVPTVSLYGPTDTRLIGAYGSNQLHIQSPLGVQDTSDPVAMMASITPAAVWTELQAILPADH